MVSDHAGKPIELLLAHGNPIKIELRDELSSSIWLGKRFFAERAYIAGALQK